MTGEQGHVQAADGVIRIKPWSGEPIEGLYAVHGPDEFSVTDGAGVSFHFLRHRPSAHSEPALRGWCR